MSWVRIDDQFPDHPKVLEAGPNGLVLHVCALCYCSRYLTDGFIPEKQISRLSMLDDPESAVAALLQSGLWDKAKNGYLIHDYLDFNPSREEVLEKRRKESERQANWRDKATGRYERNAATNAVTNVVTNASSNAVTSALVTPAPSRPGPSPSTSNEVLLSSPPRSDEESYVLGALLRIVPPTCPDVPRQEERIVAYLHEFPEIDGGASADGLVFYQGQLISGEKKRGKEGPYSDIASAFRQRLARDKKYGYNLRANRIHPNGKLAPGKPEIYRASPEELQRLEEDYAVQERRAPRQLSELRQAN